MKIFFKIWISFVVLYSLYVCLFFLNTYFQVHISRKLGFSLPALVLLSACPIIFLALINTVVYRYGSYKVLNTSGNIAYLAYIYTLHLILFIVSLIVVVDLIMLF